MARLDQYYEKYKREGLFNTSGQPTPFYTAIIMICDELFITGKNDLLPKYLQELKVIAAAEHSHPRYYHILGYIHFYSDDLKAAALAWEKEVLRKGRMARMDVEYACSGESQPDRCLLCCFGK